MRLSRNLYSLQRKRLRTSSHKEAIASIMGLHTETLNIWSHLFGTVWFCSSVTQFTASCGASFTQDTVAIIIFLGATAFCFACSTLYHIFADHSQAGLWLHIDHVGIVCAVWASSIFFILCSFEYRYGEQWAHATLITSVATLCLARLSYIHSQRDRFSTHAALGALATLPGLRYWHLSDEDTHSGLLKEFGILVIINSVGGGIYATQLLDAPIGVGLGIPDISHHVMHVMAVVGAWIYDHGLLSAYQTRG